MGSSKEHEETVKIYGMNNGIKMVFLELNSSKNKTFILQL